MTAPDWRSIESVTEEMYAEGRWIWPYEEGCNNVTPGSTSYSFFQKLVTRYGNHQVYGPIPDPPKPSPKLRRFEATYEGERVSGVSAENPSVSQTMIVHVWYGIQSSRRTVATCDLTDFKWLDPEEA